MREREREREREYERVIECSVVLVHAGKKIFTCIKAQTNV